MSQISPRAQSFLVGTIHMTGALKRRIILHEKLTVGLALLVWSLYKGTWADGDVIVGYGFIFSIREGAASRRICSIVHTPDMLLFQ